MRDSPCPLPAHRVIQLGREDPFPRWRTHMDVKLMQAVGWETYQLLYVWASPQAYFGFLLTGKLSFKSGRSKKPKIETDGLLLRLGCRNEHSVTSAVFYWSKQSQSPPNPRGRNIDPTSQQKEYKTDRSLVQCATNTFQASATLAGSTIIAQDRDAAHSHGNYTLQ